jgi:hypothetical protein
MATNGETLAAQVDAANSKLLATVEGMSDAHWATPCKEETWPAGVTAHHVAESLGTLTGLVQAVASDAPVPPISFDALNQGNAEHAKRSANVGKAETAALLRSNIASAKTVISGLSDAQLEKTVQFPMGPMSLSQVIQGILVGHAVGHEKSILEARS